MGLTPMMQQYLEMHEQAPDAILMFRLGDFYEMFFDDAFWLRRSWRSRRRAATADSTNGRRCAGCPHHAVDSYIARLVEKGHKVAICEQMEDPALAKGIVKREIIRIVSPGTVTDSSVLDPGSNNYLMCISAGRTGQKVQENGCAVLDLVHRRLYGFGIRRKRPDRLASGRMRPVFPVGDPASLRAVRRREASEASRTGLVGLRRTLSEQVRYAKERPNSF